MDRLPRVPAWLDCDPGHDDAMAIILAGYSPSIHLLGISTVAGNQLVEKVTQNALDVLDLAGLHGIDVVQGQAKPLVRPAPLLCPEIHGETGLDGPAGGPVLPRSSRRPLLGKAVLVMFQAISQHYQQHGERVRLICTGALTNAALLLMLYPEVGAMLEVVIMAGSMGVGNTGPVQEFNIQTDPEAAKVVFESGVQLTMVPLEVTHTALATPSVLSRLITGNTSLATAASTSSSEDSSSPPYGARLNNPLAASGLAAGATTTTAAAAAANSWPFNSHDHHHTAGNRTGGSSSSSDDGSSSTDDSSSSSSSADLGGRGRLTGGYAASPFKLLVEQLLTFFASTYRSVFKFQDPPLHDPCAVAYVIAPEIFQVELMRVDIETVSELAAGQTICDIWHQSPKPRNCWVAKTMDVDHFWELLLDALNKADAASPMNERYGRHLKEAGQDVVVTAAAAAPAAAGAAAGGGGGMGAGGGAFIGGGRSSSSSSEDGGGLAGVGFGQGAVERDGLLDSLVAAAAAGSDSL